MNTESKPYTDSAQPYMQPFLRVYITRHGNSTYHQPLLCMASNVQTEGARQERLKRRRDNNRARRQKETSEKGDARFVFDTQNNHVAS